MGPRGNAFPPIGRQHTPSMAFAYSLQFGGLDDGHLVFQNGVEHVEAGSFSLVQCRILHWMDIFADQLAVDTTVKRLHRVVQLIPCHRATVAPELLCTTHPMHQSNQCSFVTALASADPPQASLSPSQLRWSLVHHQVTQPPVHIRRYTAVQHGNVRRRYLLTECLSLFLVIRGFRS